MANIIKLSVKNPDDGTTTFDQIRFYEADDSSGSGASLLNTSDVDTVNITPVDPGNTTYSHTTGSTSKYYAARYYNSSSGNISDYTTWTLGGEDRWDIMFENELQDTANAVWTAADLKRYKKRALNALYPDLYRIVIDTSLTMDLTSGAEEYEYTLPFGVFDVSEVGTGDVDNIDSTFKVTANDNWKVENNILHFTNISEYSDGDTIRLVAAKKFLSVGEVPEIYDELVMYHLRMSAYLRLADDYPRYLTFAKLQKGTAVSFENLRVHAREFERKFEEGKARMSGVMLAVVT
jgi:hypothetical protein